MNKENKEPGAPPKFREEFHEIALNLMKEGANHMEVVAAIGMKRSQFYEWIQEGGKYYNPEFSDTIKRGEAYAQAWWERNGRKAIFNSEGFNSTAYIFTMKNRFKQDYSDISKHEVTTTPLVITLDKSELNSEADSSI